MTAFDAAVHHHDTCIAALGQTIWVGSEPTFTDRQAQTPEWMNTALGGDKQSRALALVRVMGQSDPAGLVLRSSGRRYPGEEQARWNFGIYRKRDGSALWRGPPDPLLLPEWPAGEPDLDAFAACLANGLERRGWRVQHRLVADQSARCLDISPPPDPDCASGQLQKSVPLTLALLTADLSEGCPPAAQIDLPALASVRLCLSLLDCLAESALACQLPALVIAGESPPVDDTVELTTITPDPAVIEVNTAPSVHAVEFLARSRAIYGAAAQLGLTPYRLYFNGAVADSGGGGQITLGGPSPNASPFVIEPRLLPRLVRFLNRHPSLSYLYSHDFVGSGGQSARADERGTGAFDELALTLALLDRQEPLEAGMLWESLAPFLCDGAGNNHRAEINIEKLFNPTQSGRSQLGLVEFRALRMQHTPERATALACLLRAIVAMLASAQELPLIDWGRELHDRFALPYYLSQDLQSVLEELTRAGLGLGEHIEAVLWREEFRFWAALSLPGCTLEFRRALEFWPLVGDAASPEQGGASRLVDASTKRVELRLRPAPDQGQSGESGCDWHHWQVSTGGVVLPMRSECDGQGELKVFALRYRSFAPRRGLHPSLGVQAPVSLRLSHPDLPEEQIVTLHEWRPGGGAYAGLPEDLEDATLRRAERVTVQQKAKTTPTDAQSFRLAPPQALSGHCLDLRHLG